VSAEGKSTEISVTCGDMVGTATVTTGRWQLELQILDSVTRQPVGGVDVLWNPPRLPASGIFQLSIGSHQVYDLTFQRPGYESLTVKGLMWNGEPFMKQQLFMPPMKGTLLLDRDVDCPGTTCATPHPATFELPPLSSGRLRIDSLWTNQSDYVFGEYYPSYAVLCNGVAVDRPKTGPYIVPVQAGCHYQVTVTGLSLTNDSVFLRLSAFLLNQ